VALVFLHAVLSIIVYRHGIEYYLLIVVNHLSRAPSLLYTDCFTSTLTPFKPNFVFVVTRSCSKTTSSVIVSKTIKLNYRTIVARIIRRSVYARLNAKRRRNRIS
jgi:hypothetical protein